MALQMSSDIEVILLLVINVPSLIKAGLGAEFITYYKTTD